MEGDQVASLLLGMAAEGFIDFSKADLLDRRWKTKLLWFCKAYQSKKQAELLNLHFIKATSALNPANVDLFKELWKSSDKLIELIKDLSMPWLDRDRKAGKHYDEYKELLDAYKEEFGDWNDPEFRKQVEAEVEEARRKRLGINSE